MQARAHIFVSGKVQGVGYRNNLFKRAAKLGLCGWTRNLEDGRVEAVFEGERSMIENMLDWARKGPFFAKVSGVEVEWQEFKNEFKDFKIRY